MTTDDRGVEGGPDRARSGARGAAALLVVLLATLVSAQALAFKDISVSTVNVLTPTVVAGGNIQVNATLFNSGNEPTGLFRVRLAIDDNSSCSSPIQIADQVLNLNPSSIQGISFNETFFQLPIADPGLNYACVRADYTNMVVETNESNNFRSAAFTVLECDSNDDCDDGSVCTGTETCAGNVCQPGTPLGCDDGQFCNGIETCDPVSGCQSGTAPDCDDGIACTIDICDEVVDSCDWNPDDLACFDGLTCSDDICDALVGCTNTPDPTNASFCSDLSLDVSGLWLITAYFSSCTFEGTVVFDHSGNPADLDADLTLDLLSGLPGCLGGVLDSGTGTLDGSLVSFDGVFQVGPVGYDYAIDGEFSLSGNQLIGLIDIVSVGTGSWVAIRRLDEVPVGGGLALPMLAALLGTSGAGLIAARRLRARSR